MSGRPRKFKEPSRPVTVTLPERTLDRLELIDSDRARAIVKAVDGAVEDEQGALRRVDVIEMAPGTGLLVVPATRTLAKIPWLKMIEIAPGRFLIAIQSGTAIEKVEVALNDLIDEAKRSAPQDDDVLTVLRETVAKLRRKERVSKAEVLLVDI
jgi:hypothetical protein